MHRTDIDALLSRIQATSSKPGNPRTTAIVNRIVRDLFYTIEDMDVQPGEFWTAVDYLQQLGQSGEWGLVAAGLGFEVFLDERMDEAERLAGIGGGTPRTIEGPLYVKGAPTVHGMARLDDGSDPTEVLFMHGHVKDQSGVPVAGASVEVWHANSKGMYSFFDKSQPAFNLRRTLIVDGEGRYCFRSTMPAGYAVPSEGNTELLLDQIGRHGNRPAHVHFFVTAPGFRKLTTQINIDGDAFLHDDFAFATRDELIPPVTRVSDPERIRALGLNSHFAEINFDFVLNRETALVRSAEIDRPRAAA